MRGRNTPLPTAVTGYLAAALASGIVAGICVVSIRAQDAVLAGVGIAAAVALMAMLLAGSRTDLGAVDPAWTLALLLHRRVGVADLLPTLAAQAVGAVAFGAAARWTIDDLPQWSVIDQPDIASAMAVLGIIAVAGSWTVTSADTGRVPPIATGLPALGAAAALAPTYAAAANPAALFALGVAGVADWGYVFFATTAVFGGAVVGSATNPLLWPSDTLR